MSPPLSWVPFWDFHLPDRFCDLNVMWDIYSVWDRCSFDTEFRLHSPSRFQSRCYPLNSETLGVKVALVFLCLFPPSFSELTMQVNNSWTHGPLWFWKLRLHLPFAVTWQQNCSAGMCLILLEYLLKSLGWSHAFRNLILYVLQGVLCTVWFEKTFRVQIILWSCH